MNRAELIEKAARASHRQGLEYGGEHAEWDALREVTRREYRENAAAVVDALLPQVTTIEELEALHPRSLVLKDFGSYAQAEEAGSLARSARNLGEDFLPTDMTVVFKP